MKNKHGQVSETMTWIVATIIILIILLVSVFLASLAGQNKTFSIQNKFDLFAEKSLTSYLLTKDASGQTIYDEIKNEETLNDFNGNLANKIFMGLYSGYYNAAVFFGIDTGAFFNPVKSNKYFTLPSGDTGNSLLIKADDINNPNVAGLFIMLNDNKLLRLILWHS